MGRHPEEIGYTDTRLRSRRDHKKLLTLIRCVALMHQYQRKQFSAEVAGADVSYIEASIADVETAIALADTALGRSLDDLSPQARILLGLISELELETFTRRELREAVGWSDTALKVHLRALVDLEYLGLSRIARTHHYRPLYDDYRSAIGRRSVRDRSGATNGR